MGRRTVSKRCSVLRSSVQTLPECAQKAEIEPEAYIHAHVVANEDICVRVGKRVRSLRKERSWNQDDLSQHAGLGRTNLSNLERGKKNPSLRSLEILAITFEKTMSQFFSDL